MLALPLLVLSALLVVTLPAPTVHAVNGVTKDMTFLLHSVNATETAKPLPDGGSTLTYFDTTLDFNDVNVSVLVEGTQKVMQWFSVPALVGDFSADGFTLRIWANSSTGASSNAQVTLEIFELNTTTSTLVHEENLGSQDFPVTPTLASWNATFVSPHTFRAGSSIELRMTVTPGALQGIWLHYDTPQVNSRISFRGPDSLDVATIATLDWNRNPEINFDPVAENKTVYIQANVTDPLGGYDIRWVNLTLMSPFGVVLLDNVSMAHISGTPRSYDSVFEVVWNYTDQAIGEYTMQVWALDNNGHNYYHFFQQFDYDDYPDTATSTFFIDGLPVYANVKTVDSKSVPLAGARVELVSGGFIVDAKTTDPDGMVNFTMAKAAYEFQVYWQDVRVASSLQDVQSNITESNPLVIDTQVYYPVFQAEDSDGSALAGASLIFIHPNGEKLGPYKTDGSGQVTLSQVPVGTYALLASWRGVDVFNGSGDVVGNDIIAFRTAVYKLTVTTMSGDGQALSGVFVSLTDSTGLVYDAGLTGPDGTVVLLLPGGSYTVQARYVTSYMGSLYDSGVQSAQTELNSSESITLTFSDFPPPLTSTSLFYVAVGIATLLAVLGFLVFKLMRKGDGG